MPGYPFRLGTTSYIYPGNLLTNAERLAGQVDDIELVLFTSADGASNYPDAATVRRLRALADAHALSYTVHLPHDLQFDPAREHPSLTEAKRVIDLTMPLAPHSYVFHLASADAGSSAWVAHGLQAITALLPHVPGAAWLALENLETYSPHALEPVFAALPIARTLDVGHLWKAGLDVLPTLAHWLPHTRVVHLHGCREQQGTRVDHLSLDQVGTATLDPVLGALRAWQGVLTLEVFEGDYLTSRAAFDAAWGRVTA